MTGFLLGFVAFIGTLMMLIGYAIKTDNDDDRVDSLFLAGMSVAFLCMFCLGGCWFYRKEHKVKNQIKPSVEITIKDGKADTTYIYKFEDE